MKHCACLGRGVSVQKEHRNEPFDSPNHFDWGFDIVDDLGLRNVSFFISSGISQVLLAESE